MKKKSVCLLCGLICAAALAAGACSGCGTVSRSTEEENTAAAVRTGLTAEQILEGEEGEIHYSYYLPDDYDESNTYPLVVVMPGYDMMWFGEESSGSNLNWNGFMRPMKLPDGRSSRSTECCRCRYRMTPISMREAFTEIITAAEMSCLRMRQS